MPIIITNQNDDPATLTDDAANLPPATAFQCQAILVDVLGPDELELPITWSVEDSEGDPVVGAVVSGQGTGSVTIVLPTTATPGSYTILAEDSTEPTPQTDSHTFTLVAAPPITVGVPNQPVIGGSTQFQTTFPEAITWSVSAGGTINSTTGLATWSTAGSKTVTYTTANACAVTLAYVVYPAISVAELDDDCVTMNTGETLALTVTGGSGTYSYAVSGQNSITQSGVITSGLYGGEYVVTITDNTAGIIQNVPLCIGSQTQFCVGVEQVDCSEVSQVSPCCEINVDCGESVALKVPTFHLRVDGKEEAIRYKSYGNGVIGEEGYLRSGSTVTNAVANTVNTKANENLFEIVTSLDAADIANAPFGIGFSQNTSGSGVDSIKTAVVWFTDAGTRYVELRQEGVAVAGSRFQISQGDAVSAGYKNGLFVLYINNLLKFELVGVTSCGTEELHISIEQPNKSIGGNLTGLTWAITTPGSPSEVGSINSNGMYVSPSSATYSVVNVEATVGNATFRLNIRNIKPTIRYTKPNAFLAGRTSNIYVGPYIPGFNEVIRLAKDGSPDALQNPGMIDLGTLQGSANFQEQFEFQDFEDDRGIYYSSISKELAELTATFLEVRDLDKMAALMGHATLQPKQNGATELSVGGKLCGLKELRVIMVTAQGDCSAGSENGWDVIYIPRVQNKGNLGLNIGRTEAGVYELTLSCIPDYTRPPGKQLYSLYQLEGCASGCGV